MKYFCSKRFDRTPEPVYEISDLRDHPIEGEFCNYQLAEVEVKPETEFKTDGIIRSRRRIERIVKW
jgi:hypothetical protein